MNHVVELDDGVGSPQNETNARITNIYAALDMPLARIQRSRSREKGQELLANVKATAKSCLSIENRSQISFSGDSKSKKDIHQVTRDKHRSEVDKCNDISGAIFMTVEEKGDKANDRASHSDTFAKCSSSYEKPSVENDLTRKGLYYDKENLDGGIMLQPTSDLLQQYGRVIGVMKGVNLPDFCVGTYTSKKSRIGKTQVTQSQNKSFCGRITRSRSSSQQTSGTNRSSNIAASVSCNLKDGGGALSHSVGVLVHKVNASNKLLGACETCQALSDTVRGAQAICNYGFIEASHFLQHGFERIFSLWNHQEKAGFVVGNGQIDAPIVMQPVNSGTTLDPVTSGCSMKVKPKQLNFDEISECDFNGVCSPLSKKRKLDRLFGQEGYPSKESAPSIHHKSRSSFFEQKSVKENVLSSSLKASRTDYYNNNGECVKDETMHIGLEMNENPVVEDVEHNSMVSLHDDVTCEVNIYSKQVGVVSNEEMHSGKALLNEDHTSSLEMQIKEGDLGHKGEETVACVFIPVSQNSKSSFISSLTKQGNKDFEVGLGSSKSKDFEVGTNLKLSTIKVSSAKSETCSLDQQKNVEYQPKCFSNSRKLKVRIQRDAIRLNLKTPENNLYSVKESAPTLSFEKINLSQSADIQSGDKSFHVEIFDLPEQRESLHELQATEATVTEGDDETTATTDTLKQSERTSVLNFVKKAVDVGPINPFIDDDVVVTDISNFDINLSGLHSYDSFQLSQHDDKTMAVSDAFTPSYEHFIIDEEIGNLNMENNESEIDFDTLEIPSTTIARASIIEQICKSASMQTPLAQLSSTFKQYQIQDLYGFMENGNHGILDHMDIGTTVSLDEDSRKHLQTSGNDSVFPQHQKFGYGSPFYWQPEVPYSSPAGKLWEISTSSSGSSEKQLSSNVDLTCFPIEEDPSSNEERENVEEVGDEPQENVISKIENEHLTKVSPGMKIERTENDYEVAVEIQDPHESTEAWSQHAIHVSINSIKYLDRCSPNSVSIQASVPRTCDKVKYKPKIHHGFKASTYDKEKHSPSTITRDSSRGNFSEVSRNKSSMRSGILTLSQKRAKHSNIVSNITSFTPIVQQKQAASACAGKRYIKVKALEAAEAAKCREEDKENERRMKKEAFKLKLARIRKENVKEMELNLIKKQQELKKKEADTAAWKRLREEEDRKQAAKKRKLVGEAQKNQKLKLGKTHTGKEEIEKLVKNTAIAENEKSENLRQHKNADENSVKKPDTELRTHKTLANAIQQVKSVFENDDASDGSGGKEKGTSINEKSPVKIGPVKLSSQETSYDISPYQSSDDEDDEEDDLPTKKFIPSWASKNRVAMVLPLQEKLDPESVFPVHSFCSMDEVLLPRGLKAL